MGEAQTRTDKALPEGSAVMKARAALKDGDYSLARSLAEAVMTDATAPDRAKDEAKSVLSAVKVDRAPIVVGAIMLAVLIALFTFVLTQKPV